MEAIVVIIWLISGFRESGKGELPGDHGNPHTPLRAKDVAKPCRILLVWEGELARNASETTIGCGRHNTKPGPLFLIKLELSREACSQ